MAELIDQLASWLNELEGKHPTDWRLLPDIGLYMDQVQTYVDRQLGLFRRDENDRLLTPAMINNYIKDNLIPRAEMKKYAPAHLALLIMIGALKQVLSIPNLHQLLSVYREPTEVEDFYHRFLDVQQDSLRENAGQVLAEMSRLKETADSAESSDEAAALRNLALQLSIEARIRILIAEKILSLLTEPKAQAPKPEEPAKKTAPNKT